VVKLSLKQAIDLKITINPEDGSAIFDFDGTGPEGLHNLNTPPAVAKSAVLYCLRCLIGIDIPLNSGCLAPIDVQIPSGTLLCPSEHVAVSSGNTETSQRVTDVVFKAFEATAASQGVSTPLPSATIPTDLAASMWL
jgi:5-oxoprolinase (ATP-hydrolysing)